ncbi:DUF1177 domain-containing protein [Serratia ureilytica]
MIDSAFVSGRRRRSVCAYPAIRASTLRAEGPKGAPILCASRSPAAQAIRWRCGADAGHYRPPGGIGARPTRIGLVSDGDGAIAAIAAALKLAEMQRKGDTLPGM